MPSLQERKFLREAWLRRRSLFLGGTAAFGAVLGAQAGGFAATQVEDMARDLAARPFQAPADDLPPALGRLDYDRWRRIVFRREAARWAGDGSGFTLQGFARGYLFPHRVDLHDVAGGVARPWAWNAADFSFDGLVEPPAGLGFAGFKLLGTLNAPDRQDEIVSFLGASYFRALGRGHAYGISARAISLHTGGAEEFPEFRAFWIERPAEGAVVIHALLDGPSLAGAYRFTVKPGAETVMDVAACLFPRVELTALGLAPASSMFRGGSQDPGPVPDGRPAVHDSDGLLLETASGERIWRPLGNPGAPHLAYIDAPAPRGFGLLQRSRRFADFGDAEARYHDRPSLWVEPVGAWGPGRLGLLELPTRTEYEDNIAVFWQPARPVPPGVPFRAAWRLRWTDDAPARPGLAAVAATRRWRGGNRFEVDFAGAPEGEPVLNASRGSLGQPEAMPIPGGLRIGFDFRPPAEGAAQLELHLLRGGRPVAETWSYRWTA
jgi:glucans biosynthesis protein